MAQYFNTVGSKEGWTPSTLKSSRSNRDGASTQRTAEDFMDAEDLEELKSSRTLQTNEQFDLLGGTQAELASRQAAASSSSAALRDLVRPSDDRIGEKLLRRMGWREGQGIGPRISAKARRRQAKELGLLATLEDDADDDEASKHLFAPLDRPLALYDAKEDMRGLGSDAIQTLHQAVRSSDKGKGRAVDDQPPKRSGPIGGAFGIGALEEADEDDYADADGRHGYRALHSMTVDDDDLGLDGSDDVPVRGKSTARSTSRYVQAETFNDGTPVVRGFRLSASIVQPDKWSVRASRAGLTKQVRAARCASLVDA